MLKLAARSKYYTVPIVECTFDIIELLRRQAVPMKVASIAETTGIALSSTYRIVRTLVDRGYLIRDESGHYMVALDYEKTQAQRSICTAGASRSSLEVSDASGDVLGGSIHHEKLEMQEMY